MNSTTLRNPELTSLTRATLYDAAMRKTTSNAVIEPGAVLLDLYRVESEPIKGGMGEVWQVHHNVWNTELAMKQPQATQFQSEEHKLNFFKECESWINLGLHPHIVSCYYVREVNGVPSIFSEWMDGGSLKSQIVSGALYESGDVLERILDIAIQSARGLYYAHQNKLIHQDVKPDNLLLTLTGEVKVADFGVARSRSFMTATKAASTTQTDDGTVHFEFGGYTRTYCSPEQASRKKKLTRRTDIYSWAVSVLEMFLGWRPWEIGSAVGSDFDYYLKMEMHATMPKALQDLLRHCLSQKPGDRPHDFGKIDTALLAIYKAETGNPYPREKPKAATETAESLNNRALSFLDLGKPEEAQKCWERALAITPNHGDTIYNQSVYLWEHGKLDDLEVLGRLAANRLENTNYYMAQIHMARGDYFNAIKHLQKAKESPDDPDKIERMLYQLQQTQTETRYSEDARNSSRYDESYEMIKETDNGKCLATFIPRIENIESFVICPDGKTAVAVGEVIAYWDIQTATKIRTVDTEKKGWFATFSPDGKTILTDHVFIAKPLIRQWDITTGECVGTFAGQEEDSHYYQTTRFSPDGKTILCGGYHTLKGYDTATGKCIFSYGGKESIISSIAFTPDGKRALTSSDDGMVKLLSLKTGKCMRKFMEDHVEPIDRICFGPDGKTVYLTNDKNTVICRDIATGQIIRKYENAGYHVQFNPDGKTMVSFTYEKVRIWNVSTGQCIRTFSSAKYNYGTISISFDGDGKMMAVCYEQFYSHDGLAKIYALPKLRPCEAVLSRISQTGKILESKVLFDTIAASAKKNLKNRDIGAALEQIGELAKIQPFGRSEEYYEIRNEAAHYCVQKGLLGYHTRFTHFRCYKVVISRTGEKVLLFNWEKPITLVDVRTGTHIDTYGGHRSEIKSADFSADDKTVLFGYEDGTMTLCDTATGERIRSFGEGKRNSRMNVVCISPNKTTALSGSNDGELALWDIQTGECIRIIDKYTEGIESACFSPDGKRILCHIEEYRKYNISGSIYAKIFGIFRLYDVDTGELIQSRSSWSSSVSSIFFDPDGKTAMLSDDGSMTLWNIDGWQHICNFDKQSEKIKYFCISSNGKMAISISGGIMKLWDIRSQRCIRTFEGFGAWIYKASFSLDGTKIIAGGENGIIVYDLDHDLYFPGWHDWDDGALPYLQSFLTLLPDYTEEDFQSLIIDLQNHGYGWLRPQGVRTKLDELQFDC
jgi:WD40 repeat protein